MQLQGMDLNSFFLDAIDHEAIKVAPTPTIKTAFLVIVLCQKLPRPSYKSNVNTYLTLSSLFLEVEISMAENFLSFLSAPLLRW